MRLHRAAVLSILVAGLVGCGSGQPATVRVLTYNIHHGEGMDRQIDLERVAGVIRRSEADLVALQEVDRGVERSGRVDQADRLAELTGMRAIFEKNIDFQGGEYGNAVLSRLPIDSHENHYLPKSPGGEQRGALEVHVQVGGEELVFFGTHFDHRSGEGERVASVAMLRELVEKYLDFPVIVAGDLNAGPDSETMSDAAAFLMDVCDAEGPPGPTYPADEPVRRIDHILCNRHPGLRCTGCRVIPEALASDHRPVLAVFELAAH